MGRQCEVWLRGALVGIFLWAFLTLWIPSRWAVASTQVALCLLTLAWLLARLSRSWPVCFDVRMLPPAIATIWAVAQVAAGRTVYRWATEQAALDWFLRLVAFFLAFQLYRHDAPRRRLLAALPWLGFTIAVLATLQRFTSPQRILWLFPTDLKGTMGPFVYHNQYAAFIETILPLALLPACTRRGPVWLYSLIAAMMIASVAAAESRAGTAVALVETLLVLALAARSTRRGWRSLSLPAAATALLVLVLALTLGWGPLWQKLRRADPWGERRDLTYASIDMAFDRPAMGFGLGTWAVAYPAYARFDDGRFDNQAHNDWAQWAAEGGIPFFMLMLALAGMLVRPALRSIWGVGLLAVLVHCLVDYHFQQRPAFGYYYFALAALLAREAASLATTSPGRES